jgi:AGZA family xanthine/uracil permease-like MFS transporter
MPEPVSPAASRLLERQFRLSERGTTVRTELMAGVTTFLTMSYILFVNPMILADAGIPKQAALAATILASVFCTALFALWANYPIAVAPGMGLNAFFTYSVVLGKGLSWQTALGAVFISGLVFLLLSVTGVRRRLVEGVPEVLRSAIGAGIGLFIAFIGLKNAGVIVKSDATLVTLGHLAAPGPLLALLGLIVATALMVRRVPGALAVSILGVTGVAMAMGAAPAPRGPTDVFATGLPSLGETFLAMDLKAALGYGLLSIIFSFTVVELFDNLATLIGLTRKAGLMDSAGRVPDLDKALVADAAGTMVSAAMGSTALNAYVENAAGIAEGGRTGLTALTVAGLFASALLVAPLIGFVPVYATAPALVLVGALMLGEIRHVDFNDLTEAVPAFLTALLMPLTFSIAEGLAFGFLSYVLLKALSGRWREIHPVTVAIALAFAVNFALHG